MGKIVVSGNVSLDGVMQDPTGEEGYKHGGWFFQIGEKDREEWTKVEVDEAFKGEALLLGRRTDEWFAERWNSRTGAWAERLKTMPKYVVSSTATGVKWGNGTVLKGDAVDEVSKLRRTVDGEILVFASKQLVHTLMENDLVDEVRLTVYPVVLGSGERLFGETADKRSMSLVKSQTLGDGLVYLIYRIARDA
jgi:dihydrofolate reductase